MESNDLYDKRHYHRFRHAQPVQIQFHNAGMPQGALSCDLSEGGVRVRVHQFIPLNTEVAVTLRLADEEVMECLGRIAWIEKDRFGDAYQAGLSFTGNESPETYQQKIYGFLSSRQRASTSLRKKHRLYVE